MISNFLKKYENKIKFYFNDILKILLCLYILFPNILDHNTLKKINNINIKIFIMLLITIYTKYDYTVSILLSIILIIMILEFNKKNIEILKKEKSKKQIN
jgi:hypothetical protein